MNKEISKDNPFSRVVALSKLGVVREYENIRTKTVLIVGIGGVGSVAAEMLVRCGVGKLVLIDYDTVELANMNRLFFRPSQVGKSKVDAAKETLTSISSETQIETLHANITTIENYNILKSKISGVDLLLSCVDNYAARIALNRVCLEQQQVWMESGVSETAFNGHIQLMRPGTDACFECAMPVVVAEGGDEHAGLNRQAVCAASLPTTMAIIAGLLVQNVLKLLLEFGQVTNNCLGYQGMTDFFPTYCIHPNPDCPNLVCRQLSADRAEKVMPNKRQAIPTVESPYSVTNEWNIEVVGTDDPEVVEKQVSDAPPDDLSRLPLAELMSRLRK